MADPFEVRMRFITQLRNLNASVTSSQKTAQYALKHRDMDEDLHSCILEQLELCSLNARANIMYFIEHLCDMAERDVDGHKEFRCMVERDILKIVDLVAPDDGSGAANVKVVKGVLTRMGEKGYLQVQTVGELEECIKDRDSGAAGEGGVAVRGENGGEGMHLDRSASVSKARGGGAGAAAGVDKRQIEQRIEEDRERHKRLRESIWAVDPDGDAEFDRLWDETGDVDGEDLVLAKEEAEERKKMARFHRIAIEEAA